MFATNPENTAVVEKIVAFLSTISVGDTAAYITIKNATGCDVTKRQRWLYVRARDAAEKQIGGIFETVRGVGIKRLNASESPEIGLAAIRGVRRKARHGAQRLGRINSNSLSDPERKRAIAYGSLLGTIAMMADGNKARTIAAVIDPAKPIPPKDILQMFTT